MIYLYLYLGVAVTLPWALTRHLYTAGGLTGRVVVASVAALLWGWAAFMLVRNAYLAAFIRLQQAQS